MKASFTKLRLAAASVLGLVFGLNALAQAPRAPQLESPVVHPDRTVTFNFRAPNARKVELSAQFLKANQPLTADTNGVWSLTVGPVEPNLYPYAFVVDGVSVADPANQDLFPNERFKNSLVDIPGDKPSLYSVQEVPHGELTYLLLPVEDARPHAAAYCLHPGWLSGQQERVPSALPRERHD